MLEQSNRSHPQIVLSCQGALRYAELFEQAAMRAAQGEAVEIITIQDEPEIMPLSDTVKGPAEFEVLPDAEFNQP